MAPVVEGSSPFTHPNAPVAQLDRASDFESAGRPFEPDRARQAPRRVDGSRGSYMVHGAISNSGLSRKLEMPIPKSAFRNPRLE